MSFFIKYGIGIYLVITLLYKLNFLIPGSVSSALYYAMMVIGLILAFINYKGVMVWSYINYFGYFFAVLLLNLLYLIIFGFELESVLYWFAKLATTNLIIFGVVTNIGFYEKIFVKYFKFVILAMVIVGYAFGIVEESVGAEAQRLSIGYNPNDLGLFAVLGVLSIMLFSRSWYKNRTDLLLFIVLSLLMLLSGSKAALLNLVVGTIMIYGFNIRIFLFSIGFALVLLISSKLNYVTSIDRLLSNEDAFATRDEVFEIGTMTFKDAFWTGHGIDKYGWTEPSYWLAPEMALGPHNTYLSIGIMYGAIFGSVFLLMLLFQFIRAIRVFFYKSTAFVKFCALIVILTIINGFFESLIVGVNEFVTVLFWFCLGVVLLSAKEIKTKFVFT